ncbi:MAG: flavin reductase family protein, partial [Planctomycetota bacterium]|nr:flavin reductase family protein [Planctomycetota bacterium]
MQLDPEQLAIPDRYKILIGSVVPRPIAFVSTISPDGTANLAPFSFFNAISSNPLSLLFCPANNSDGSEKDTLRNVAATNQFVVNVATEAYARRMAATAEALPYGVSEFDMADFDPAPSTKVKPPRVGESPVAFECEVMDILRLAANAPA